MLTSRVVAEGNSTRLVVEGVRVPALAYISYYPPRGDYERFSRIGYNLFSTGIYFSDKGINPISGIRPFRALVWTGPGAYDFSVVDADFSKITAHGEQAYIIPRVYLETPDWWDAAHPGELCRDQAGHPVRQSFASRLWLEECRKNLAALINYIENSRWNKYVIGYHVAFGSTEECFHPSTRPYQLTDYSDVNLVNYRIWLTRQYNDIETLNEAWGRAYESFDQIMIPPPSRRLFAARGEVRDPILEKPVTDFYRYHNEMVADTVIELCRDVKELTGNRQIAGAFYGYVYYCTDDNVGHHALGRVLESPYVDFLASPASYDDARPAGIDWPYLSATRSVLHHGKLWFAESDVRTNLTQFLKDSIPEAAPLGNANYEAPVWKGPRTAGESVELLRKAFAKVLCEGVGTWWFDMWGGWYAHGEFEDLLKRAAEEYCQAGLRADIRSSAQIAVLLDEEGYHSFRPGSPVLRSLISEQLRQLGFLGAPCHTYLLSDMDSLPVDEYRMILFLGPCRLSSEQKHILQSRYQKNGRVLVFAYMPAMEGAADGVRREPITGCDYSQGEPGSVLQVEAGGQVYPGDPVYDPGIVPHPGEDDIIAGRVQADGRPGLIFGRREDWTAVWSLAPCIPADLLRNLAALAGVHIYNYSGDIIYSNSDYIAFHAASDGPKRIYPPAPCTMREVWTGERVAVKEFLDFACRKGQSYLWRIESGHV